MNPKITVLLPVFNDEGHIKQSVASVIEQTFQNWELLVLDDGSTDRSIKMIKDLLARDPRIKLINNPTNIGLIETLNKGLSASHSDLIARIDSDDYWNDKTKLQKQFDFLNSNPEYGLIGTCGIAVDEQDKHIFNLNYPETDSEIRSQILRRNCFIHSSVMFRKNLALKCGGYNQNYKHVEDYTLWLQLGTISKLANLPEQMITYRINQKGITQNNTDTQINSAIKLSQEYKNKYPNYLSASIKLKTQKLLLRIFGNKGLSLLKEKVFK
jgi:glycosyltransferase involved in cell wall biosynthesis